MEQLKIFDANPEIIVDTVRAMLERGEKAYIQTHHRNDSILPMIVQLTRDCRFHSLTAQLNDNTPIDGLSHCWAVAGGKKKEVSWILAEAGTGQHPRMVLQGSSDKFQIYHLTLFAALQPKTAHVALASEFTKEEAREQLESLMKVTRKNSASAEANQVMTVAHLCGNGFAFARLT